MINTLFQLLRYAMGISKVFPIDISEEKWRGIYKIAQQQSLLGVLFYGIQQNPSTQMERDLLLQWYAVYEQNRSANQRVNKVAVELSDYFRKLGFRSCILKGQGNAMNYPDPYVRTCGDIDIWIEGGHDKIMKFVNAQWHGMLERYHHVEIPAWDGVPVEIHFVPSYMHAPWMNKRIQRWFAENAEEQFSHEVELPDGAGSICVPTTEFDLIYQLSHMYRHLFSEGIGLRQMMDYYFVLKAHNDGIGQMEKGREMKNDVVDTLRYLGLYKFAGAVMWVLKETLGLEEEMMIVEPNEKEGRFLLDEIMIGGNFGQYDTRLGSKKNESVVHRYFRMSLRNMRYIMHYPLEALCEPLFRTWYFFWRVAHR